ncbi:glycosyltransferase family 4 protein [Cytobacillus sp. OWB-43]|uniref:glycosyltransferase family 4 protein n=1 Tax=Cytobacillus sp. OWB-43 TaxID=3108468 RepID=UPI002AFE5F5E|nr:glycosyltransferase family 4 protein [Cytobacillus sp. OWB-43]MEA1853617.1 glycosyltransferase family 4 protein [Cytobacillus sp. OWB-43]
MKVLHINSYFNGSMFYKNLYDKQIEKGIDLKVYVPVNYSTNVSNLNLGEYTTISSNHGRNERYIFQVKHSKIYKDIIRKLDVENYELIHAHSLFSNGYIAEKIYEKYKIPYIVAVRNTDVYTFFKYMVHLRKIGIDILRKAQKVIFLSTGYRNYIIDNYIPEELKEQIKSKSIVIPNGIEDFWYDNKTGNKILNKKKIKLIYVGKINKNKNISATIKSIEILIREGFEVYYTIVGKIEDEKIYNKIKELPFVEYLGAMTKEELLEVYRNHDIFIMPSIHESFGLVYAEAISQGLPVVYSEGQGFDGQFEEGLVGNSVNPRSPEDIAQKINSIINKYDAISKNCFKLSHKFKWEFIEQEYNNIYSNIIKN